MCAVRIGAPPGVTPQLYRRLDVRSRGELMFQLANTPEGLGGLLLKERARLSANLARLRRD
jgi:hypothetical protein